MKIMNNDIKELESHIIMSSQTKWIYDIQKEKEEQAAVYLKKKYNFDNYWLDKCTIEFVEYLNSLSNIDLFELLNFAKKIYIQEFWKKHWNIAFSFFAWRLMEDWEDYSNILNKSKKINKYLFWEFNKIYKFFEKNHKYEIWKYIYMIMKNLWLKIPVYDKYDIYDYWENYTITKT